MSGQTLRPLSHEVVRASAGAGKTYQLTTRYLQLLARGEPAQHTLATTFTRKAAGEVLSRVLGRLADACRDPGDRAALGVAIGKASPTREDCVAMLRSLTDGLNRLSVGTIDGFFSRASRAMAFELGLPSDPRMIDETAPLAKQLRSDAIHAVLGEQAARDGGMVTLIEMLRRLHHDTAQRSVTDAIDSIVRDLNETYCAYKDRALWDALPTTGLLSGDLLGTAIHALEQMADLLPVSSKNVVYTLFRDRYEELIAAAYAGDWSQVLGNGLVKKVDEGAPKYGHAPIDADWYAAIKPLLIHAKAVRLRALAEQTLATYDLLKLFDAQYSAMRNAQRVMLFSDLTNLLADGLPNMGEAGIDELCYRLDARVTHLLLDEFQDTSLRQWAVLEPFAEQIAATSDGSRSLFVVGDTKQAIYGWRGGCAELFDEVEALPGVERETLSKSWRSSQVVLDAVNKVFGGLSENAALDNCREAADAWQAGFETHVAQKDELPGHVVLHSTANDAGTNGDTDNNDEDDGDGDDTAPPDAHAAYVAKYIQKLHADNPGRSIGVLMRSRRKGRTLMHALRTLGVYAAEEGGNPIDNMPSVSAVLSAIQLADHPGDSVARFHVMNTPVAEAIGLDPSQGQRGVDAAARRVRRALMDHGYAAVIAQWTRVLAPSCDARSLRRLMQLVELAEDFDEHDAGLRPSFFVESARAAKVEDASPALVRVMTIHASKGLEFDLVVLPDLDTVLSGQDHKALVVLNRDSPVAPVRGIYRRVNKDEQGLLAELQSAHEQQAYEKRTEDLCLLYVAMTRARQGLHMLVRPIRERKKKDKDGNKVGTGEATAGGHANLSYASVLRQALCATPGVEDFAGGVLLYESGDAGWSGAGGASASVARVVAEALPPISLASKGKTAGRSWRRATPSQMHNAGAVSAADLLRISDTAGRDYGTLVHTLFEQVGFVDEDGVPDEASLASAASACRAGGEDVARAIAQVRRAVEVPAVRELLSRAGADGLWRERSFVARIGGKLVNGKFDRVHLTREGETVTGALLIDFKTDRVDDGSVDAAVARYAGQIGLYAEALSAMLGIERSAVTSKLCFVGDGRVIEVG